MAVKDNYLNQRQRLALTDVESMINDKANDNRWSNGTSGTGI